MFHRPHPNEDDKDLIKQDREFRSNSNEGVSPAAKVVRVGKRKTEASKNEASSVQENLENASNQRPKSRFAESYTKKKKKKDSLVDNTVLDEAVSDQRQVSVLSRIVERDVPALASLTKNWKHAPSPLGFPKAPKLSILENQSTATSFASSKKSLYMQQLEKDGLIQDFDSVPQMDLAKSKCVVDEELILLGDKSYVVDGVSGLGDTEEAKRIHQENISKLSEMSHTERLKERNEMLAQLTPDQVQFLQALRMRKRENEEKTANENTESHPGAIKISSLKQNLEETKNVNKDLIDMDEPMEVVVDTENENYSSIDKFDEKLSLEEERFLKEKRTVSFKECSEKEEKNSDEQSQFILPISPSEAKKWIHMDKVELDKLRWMTEVPQPKPLKNNEGFVARFSFEGDLLPYDADVTWREGLHHHGEEPARAGYTLDELFIFVRSQVVQQRHIGLKTIANIIRNAKEGLYDTCLDTPVIQLMVDAGIVILLRFAIDESTALVYQEALRALYFLVSSEPDEKCISMTEPYSPDGMYPGISSLTHATEKAREELDAEEKELKDVEIIKLDIIRALVRMDAHIRLRYFLETITLSAPDVIHILGILKRIGRHSLTAAWTLVNTPRLLSIIINNFLPHNISPLLSGQNIDQISSVYGVPLRHALSFFKVLAERGRQIATLLVGTHDMMSRILAYVSIEPNNIQMPLSEVLILSQEAYSLWSIFLAYGLIKAQQSFSNIYPLIVKQLIFYRDKVDINENVETNQYNYDVGAHLANVISKCICIAATKPSLIFRMKNNIPSFTSADGKEQVLPPPELNWEDFEAIITIFEICLSKWLSQLMRNPTSFLGLKLVGSFCNVVTIYYEKWQTQPSFEGVRLTQKIEHIYNKVITLLLTSQSFVHIVERMRNYSAIRSKLKPGNKRDPRNLGSLACVSEGGEISPIVQKESPYPFLLPFMTLLNCIFKLHPTLDPKAALTLLNGEHLKKYLKEICVSPNLLGQNWLTRIEVFTVANILELASNKVCDDPILYHETALIILPLVHKGDEHLINSLIKTVICNPDFATDLCEVETQIDSLSMKNYTPLKSPALSQPILSTIELTKRISKVLPAIGHDLVKNILNLKLLQLSLVRESCSPIMINNLVLEDEELSTVLDRYWVLKPLRLLSNFTEHTNSDQTSSETILSVTRWVQMTFFMLKYRKSVTYLHTNSTGWFRYLAMIFLASSDLFLDVQISSYVQACLVATLEQEWYKNLDWTLTFPDLPYCYDWYKQMLQQYESVSYGDSTFALFILVPLQRYWPSSYRALLFGEHADALPFIRLTLDEVSQFIPLEQFITPAEDDENVITNYRSAIGSKKINESRNNFLFTFANHHITNYMKRIVNK